MLRSHRTEIILVAALVLVCAFYARWAYIPSFADRHVAASEELYHYDVGDPGRWFSAWSLGDGQAFAMIAIDPTGAKLAKEVGHGGYRFSRAGYGVAAWAVSGGQPDFVPYALAIVGGIFVIASLVLAVRLRHTLGARAWLIVLNPALFIGFAGDTAEPMGIFLLVYALGWGSWVAASLLGVVRPTFLVGLWGRWKALGAAALAATALALYGIVAFGFGEMIPPGNALGPPFVAYMGHLGPWNVLLGLFAIGTLIVGIRARDWSWILAAILVLSFGDQVLKYPVNAWRAAGFLPVLWAFGVNYVPTARRSAPETVSAAV